MIEAFLILFAVLLIAFFRIRIGTTPADGKPQRRLRAVLDVTAAVVTIVATIIVMALKHGATIGSSGERSILVSVGWLVFCFVMGVIGVTGWKRITQPSPTHNTLCIAYLVINAAAAGFCLYNFYAIAQSSGIDFGNLLLWAWGFPFIFLYLGFVQAIDWRLAQRRSAGIVG